MDKQFEFKNDGTQYFMNQIWMLNFGDLRKLVMDEAHMLKYFIHTSSDNMYLDLKSLY